MPHPRPTRPATAATIGGLVLLGILPAPAATASVSGDTAACRVAIRADEGRGSDTNQLLIPRPGPVDAFLSSSDEGYAIPWHMTRPPALAGVAATTRRGRTTLRICGWTDAFEQRNVVATGRAITIARGERLDGVAIADRWIAWATHRAGAIDRPLVRWRRMAGSDRTLRRARPAGRLTALVPDVDGHLVTSTVRAGRQQVVLRSPGQAPHVLAVRHGVSADPRRRAHGPVDVWLWEPRTVAVGDLSSSASPWDEEIAGGPERLFELPLSASRCRRPAGVTTRLSTRALDLAMTSSSRWAGKTSGPSETIHLRLCDRQHRPVAIGDAGGSTDDDGSNLDATAITGDAVVLQGDAHGGSGSGASTYVIRQVLLLEPGPDGTLRVGRRLHVDALVVGANASAWITATDSPALWISDRQGTRAVALDLGRDEWPWRNRYRLTLQDRNLRVTTPSGAHDLPIDPLDPDDVALSANATRLDDQGCNGDQFQTCPAPAAGR